jgi:hypothetical protein
MPADPAFWEGRDVTYFLHCASPNYVSERLSLLLYVIFKYGDNWDCENSIRLCYRRRGRRIRPETALGVPTAAGMKPHMQFWWIAQVIDRWRSLEAGVEDPRSYSYYLTQNGGDGLTTPYRC